MMNICLVHKVRVVINISSLPCEYKWVNVGYNNNIYTSMSHFQSEERQLHVQLALQTWAQKISNIKYIKNVHLNLFLVLTHIYDKLHVYLHTKPYSPKKIQC
jgi:hypothetical protein